MPEAEVLIWVLMFSSILSLGPLSRFFVTPSTLPLLHSPGAAAICILVHGGHSFPSGILSTTLCQDCAVAAMDYTALVLGYRNHRALPPCNLLVYKAK